jgi:hypothetical protein
MKKSILTVCPTCRKRLLIPRESAHPASLEKIIRDCEKHQTEESVDIFLDKFGREIDPKSGGPV